MDKNRNTSYKTQSGRCRVHVHLKHKNKCMDFHFLFTTSNSFTGWLPNIIDNICKIRPNPLYEFIVKVTAVYISFGGSTIAVFCLERYLHSG